MEGKRVERGGDGETQVRVVNVGRRGGTGEQATTKACQTPHTEPMTSAKTHTHTFCWQGAAHHQVFEAPHCLNPLLLLLLLCPHPHHPAGEFEATPGCRLLLPAVRRGRCLLPARCLSSVPCQTPQGQQHSCSSNAQTRDGHTCNKERGEACTTAHHGTAHR